MVQVCEDKLVLSGNANVNGERVVMFTCFFSMENWTRVTGKTDCCFATLL